MDIFCGNSQGTPRVRSALRRTEGECKRFRDKAQYDAGMEKARMI